MPIIDFIGTIVLTAVVVVNVNAVISTMPVPRAARLGFAACTGMWVGGQIALTSAGAYAGPVPYIGFAVVLPLIGFAFTRDGSAGLRALRTGAIVLGVVALIAGVAAALGEVWR